MGTKLKSRACADDKRPPEAQVHPRPGGRGERKGAGADTVLRDASGEPSVSGHNSGGTSAETRRALL